MGVEGATGLVGVYLWRVAVHSFVAGLLLYAWARHLRLPPGATRRRMLTVVLLLPLPTAAVAGRFDLGLGDGGVWMDSGRLLTIPIADGVRGWHLAASIGLVTLGVSLWQEVIPIFRRAEPHSRSLPPELTSRLESLTGWEGSVELIGDSDIMAAVSRGGDRPRLLLSERLTKRLDDEALNAVIRHELAHQRRRLWADQHLLFFARLVQLHNPVALWAFREYCVEVELACDAEAVLGGSPKPLARALLAVYKDTDRRDYGSRSVLRQRIDVLLGRVEGDGDLPLASLVFAVLALALLLPWIA